MKTRKRKHDEILGLFGDVLGSWQPDLSEKIGLEPKVGGVFWESYVLQS